MRAAQQLNETELRQQSQEKAQTTCDLISLRAEYEVCSVLLISSSF
jgi:hypothetical protein